MDGVTVCHMHADTQRGHYLHQPIWLGFIQDIHMVFNNLRDTDTVWLLYTAGYETIGMKYGALLQPAPLGPKPETSGFTSLCPWLLQSTLLALLSRILEQEHLIRLVDLFKLKTNSLLYFLLYWLIPITMVDVNGFSNEQLPSKRWIWINFGRQINSWWN